MLLPIAPFLLVLLFLLLLLQLLLLVLRCQLLVPLAGVSAALHRIERKCDVPCEEDTYCLGCCFGIRTPRPV